MKRSFLKLAGKKFITAVFLSASVLLTSFTGNATETNSIEIISSENTNIQFTGSTADALLFKVNINNAKADNFILTIKNSEGDVLFSKSFKDVNFQKQFKVLKDDRENGTYYFTITSENKNLENTYAISATTRVIDDVVINKL